MSYQPILDYIDAYWERITRENKNEHGTLIGLPHPYLIPAVRGEGGLSMFQEMYYWDSFFIALGLVGTAHEQRIIDMTENMAYLYERFGVIPNASRYYMLSRSQPPFLTQMIRLSYQVLSEKDPAAALEFLRRMTPIAVSEHETVWHGTAQPHHRLVHAGLSRYFDINYLDMLASCESGWDHSTRCDDRWLDHLPVDLNALLYLRETDFAEFYTLLGDAEQAEAWQNRADTRRLTIFELMWDEADGIFYDYDYVNQKRTPHPSLAAFYPLWAKLATPEQAKRIVSEWLPKFEFVGGLVTSLEAKEGRQWAYPNGWSPLMWVAVEGLLNYGYHTDARRIMQKWCDNNAELFHKSGVLWEKYNVVEIGGKLEDGLYGSVPGFGWTNGVFKVFAQFLGEPA